MPGSSFFGLQLGPIDWADVTPARGLSRLLRRVYNCLIGRRACVPTSSGPDIKIGPCLRDYLAPWRQARFLELSARLQLRCWVEDSIYRFLIFVPENRESIYGVFASPWHGRLFCSIFMAAPAGAFGNIRCIWIEEADELPWVNCRSLPRGGTPVSCPLHVLCVTPPARRSSKVTPAFAIFSLRGGVSDFFLSHECRTHRVQLGVTRT